MDKHLLRVLRCPFCSGSFAASGKLGGQDKNAYTVLSCYCGRYPVVAGIPILVKGRVSFSHTADEVIQLIETERNRDALLAVLMPAPPSAADLAPDWLRKLPSFRGLGRLRSLFGKSALHQWREKTEALLTKPFGRDSLKDFLELYYHRSGGFSELQRLTYYDYFSLRLGQPRYLTAASLVTALHQSDSPVLDLACGIGHITRLLTGRNKGQLVIGIDQDFLLVYLAKNCFAQEADYVCAGADISLPVADRSCGLTVCSDAFYLLFHQASCMRELRRVTRGDGVLVLPSVRNGRVQTFDKTILATLPPEAYQELLADMPHRIVMNDAIMDSYVRKEGPPLASQAPLHNFAKTQWLSVVASYRTEVLRDYQTFEDWPHVEGVGLDINPLYEQQKDPSGNILLRRVFPSRKYEIQNAYLGAEFQPESVILTSKTMADVLNGNRTPETVNLIKQGVVVGFPGFYHGGSLEGTADREVASAEAR